MTTGLLLPLAKTVDIIEPIAKFTEKLSSTPGVGRVFKVGLEEWQPDEDGEQAVQKYDIIWIQWCVGHLTDDQLVAYLVQCKKVLESERGIIVVKENQSTGGMDLFDPEDSCVTRCVLCSPFPYVPSPFLLLLALLLPSTPHLGFTYFPVVACRLGLSRAGRHRGTIDLNVGMIGFLRLWGLLTEVADDEFALGLLVPGTLGTWVCQHWLTRF